MRIYFLNPSSYSDGGDSNEDEENNDDDDSEDDAVHAVASDPRYGRRFYRRCHCQWRPARRWGGGQRRRVLPLPRPYK